MKNIRFSLIFFLCLIAPIVTVFSQNETKNSHTYSISYPEGKRGDGVMNITISNSALEIVGYDGREVIVEAKGYKQPPKRAEGLRPLYNTAVDNTGIGLSFQKEGDNITLEKATREDVNYTIRIPANTNLRIKESNWNGDDFHLKGIKGSIEIEAKSSDVKLEDVSGPLVLSSTNGDITIAFSEVNQEAPISIKAVNGFLDATMPKKTKAKLKLRSTNGEVYTNFDITFSKKEDGKSSRYRSSKTIEGTINGGGVEISLNAINDDIYLRSK